MRHIEKTRDLFERLLESEDAAGRGPATPRSPTVRRKGLCASAVDTRSWLLPTNRSFGRVGKPAFLAFFPFLQSKSRL
jgi:hypothetical protein